MVTVLGTLFGGDATVLYIERTARGALTGNFSECEWRTNGIPGVMCNDSVVRWVRVFAFAGLSSLDPSGYLHSLVMIFPSPGVRHLP